MLDVGRREGVDRLRPDWSMPACGHIGRSRSSRYSGTPGLGIVNTGATPFDVVIGSITFEALAGLTTDEPDAFLGFFDPGDHLDEDSGAPQPHLAFGDLAFNLPEPERATASLVLLGVIGACMTRRGAVTRRAGAE